MELKRAKDNIQVWGLNKIAIAISVKKTERSQVWLLELGDVLVALF